MVQKKQPAHNVKKKPNAKSHEKLSCFGSIAAPAPQSAKATNATMPSKTDRPAKRPLSKYSPSGVDAFCKRSLISLAPPVWLAICSQLVSLPRVSPPAACSRPVSPSRRDVPAEHRQSPRSDCVAERVNTR